jgi:23S rRNA (cytidine1920-2'-O)/16S rRNA (cytidine1409-2'-O)-methyltransferase
VIKQRLDVAMMSRGITSSRSQAESWIRLGKVLVDGKKVSKSSYVVTSDSVIILTASEQYVSRAGLKLASVAKLLHLEFDHKIVLDVGSSTGGFTDYALQHNATKVYAVDVGTDQLHPHLHGHPRIELHEKTDIRDFMITSEMPDIIVIDVSFISVRDILPHIVRYLCMPTTRIVAMVKPQFEAGRTQTNKGVIKNDNVRRQILRDFEDWSRQYFAIVDKRDSDVAGAKGNQERFYVLSVLKK